MEERLNLLKTYAISFLGIPYVYGGGNRLTGLDCSGFIIELFMAAGLTRKGFDTTAQGLFLFILKTGGHKNVDALGALAFYGTDESHISHVAFCLNSTSMIECGGGDHTTLNVQEAAKRGACVRIRPIRYRADFLCTLMPVY